MVRLRASDARRGRPSPRALAGARHAVPAAPALDCGASPDTGGTDRRGLALLLWTYPEDDASRAGACMLAFAIALRELEPFRFTPAAHAFSWIPFSATSRERQNATLVLLRKTFEYGTMVWLLRATGIAIATPARQRRRAGAARTGAATPSQSAAGNHRRRDCRYSCVRSLGQRAARRQSATAHFGGHP